MSETNGKLAAYLEEHPRMIGVLFTLVMLLSQAQPVLAGGTGGGTAGP